MQSNSRDFLPAAGSDWALPLYDPITRLMGVESVRLKVLDHVTFNPGARVLDVGCGTGTLATFVKQSHPGVDVVGLDPDPKALARARKKAAGAGISITFDEGFSDHLPYADRSFDRVFSSLMFHHIPTGQKPIMLREVRRVLKPGGSFHLVDFSRADSQGGHRHSLKHLLCVSGHFKGNADGAILSLFEEAGFANSQKTSEATMFLGLLRLAYFAASA
ncbi:MAG: class I SAM-dependent methyltransferase [Candidatus Acidiferrales bacterium]